MRCRDSNENQWGRFPTCLLVRLGTRQAKHIEMAKRFLAFAERLEEDSPSPTYYWNSQTPLTRRNWEGRRSLSRL
jgi:hypothetical protein